MNTGFLSNPAPNNGYDAVLAALAPRAAPAEGSLGSTAPSVHNRVKQTFINPVATYPFIARKWQLGWEQTFHTGDIMFIFTGTGQQVVRTTRHSILANLPVLNEIMSSSDEELKKFQNPNEWTMIGIMRNSSAASGLNPRSNVERGGNRVAPDRIINIDVRGSTRMFNYWEDICCGNHLYLAWYTKATDGKKVLLPFQEKARAGYRPALWQNNNSAIGRNTHKRVCVGWLFQGVGAGEASTDKAAIRAAEKVDGCRFKLPMLNAFLKV